LALTELDGGVPAAVTRLVNNVTVATESAVGPDPNAPQRSPNAVFGVNMPYIDGATKNPGNSFLLYKVILGLAPRCGHLDEESPNPSLNATACTPVAGQLTAPEYLCSDIQCKPEAGASVPQVDGGAPGQPGQPAPPIAPSWVPADHWKPPAAGEYNRLRGRIRGDGMPPLSQLHPTPYQSAIALSAWIAKGAGTNCPP
jgi:hypothetical protein